MFVDLHGFFRCINSLVEPIAKIPWEDEVTRRAVGEQVGYPDGLFSTGEPSGVASPNGSHYVFIGDERLRETHRWMATDYYFIDLY